MKPAHFFLCSANNQKAYHIVRIHFSADLTDDSTLAGLGSTYEWIGLRTTCFDLSIIAKKLTESGKFLLLA